MRSMMLAVLLISATTQATRADGLIYQLPEDGAESLGNYSARISSVALSPDGTLLATGGWVDSTSEIRLWKIANGKLALAIPVGVHGVCSATFSPDGKLLATGGDDSAVRVWDIKEGKQTLVVN